MVKKKWKVPVNWQMTGSKVIEADTLEEAMLKVKNEDGSMSLPDDGFYVDSSFELAYDTHEVEFVRHYENDNQQDNETQKDENKVN